MSAPKRTAVLISGRGSNLQALASAAEDFAYPAEIVLVISDRPEAGGLDFARAKGIPAALIERGARGLDGFEAELQASLAAARVELICLAGFMRVLSAGFIAPWQGRIINIHPSLLPALPGLNTHARALEAGVAEHGATAHFVTAELDRGPIIAQAAIPVLAGDDVERLAARVLALEHRLYPFALRLVANGAVRLAGDRAVVERARAHAPPPGIRLPR